MDRRNGCCEAYKSDRAASQLTKDLLCSANPELGSTNDSQSQDSSLDA